MQRHTSAGQALMTEEAMKGQDHNSNHLGNHQQKIVLLQLGECVVSFGSRPYESEAMTSGSDSIPLWRSVVQWLLGCCIVTFV